MMANMLGDKEASEHYDSTAHSYAKWMQMAAMVIMTLCLEQQIHGVKYNLVWDKMLGLKLFPNCV
jgi:hypothetical protein